MPGEKRKVRADVSRFFLVIALLCLIHPGGLEASGEHRIRKTALDNGLTVIMDIDETSPTTILQILVRGGKRADPAGKRGLSFLTTRLSVEVPDSSKVQELMSLATRFSVTAQGDHSLINIECLSENLEPSLKVLSKIILDPLFSGLRIDAVKKHMEHQGLIEEDDSVRLGHLAGLGAFFAGSPYEGSVYGDKESLKAIKNSDVSDFYSRCFVGPNMIVSLSSDLGEDTLLDLMQRYFAKIPKGERVSLDPIATSVPKDRAVHIERDTKQSYVCLAFPLPGVSPRNFALASFLENLLGKGPGSRLWPLRTEKKLAYNVNCRVTQLQSGGVFEAYLETDNSKLESAREALWQALSDLYENGLKEDELESTKTAAAAEFIRENEMKSAKAGTLAYFESAGLGLDYFMNFSSEIEALTVDGVNASIKDILNPEKALEVVIGANAVPE